MKKEFWHERNGKEKKEVCALTVRVWKIEWVAGNFVGLVTDLEILRWLFYQKSSSILKKRYIIIKLLISIYSVN